MASEREFIEQLQKLYPPPRGIVGIGDDAAVIGKQVVTKDLFVEEVHFQRRWLSRKELCWKIITPSVLDCLAMGALPRWCFLGVGWPGSSAGDLKFLFQDLKEVLDHYCLCLLGGDLVQSPRRFFSVTVIGVLKGRPLMRGKCTRGDLLFLTAPVGGSLYGLRNLQRGKRQQTKAFREPRIDVHKIFSLLKKVKPKACIDVSDGLAADLPKLVGPEKGVELDASLNWIAPYVLKSCGGKRALRTALESGEEPVLAYACAKAQRKVSGILLGSVVNKEGLFLKGKKLKGVRGYDHFAA